MARSIIEEIRRLDLLTNVKETGDYLYGELTKLSSRFPSHIQNLRGQGEGTFIAWDESSVATRDKFLQDMKKFGVNVGGTGTHGIRLRPMLIFGRHHADIFLERLDACLKASS